MAKCLICKQDFNKDTEEHYRKTAGTSFRYAHVSCYENNLPPGDWTGPIAPVKKAKSPKETEDYLLLKDYVNKNFGKSNMARNMTLCKKYKDKFGFTDSGIRGALIYFYEVKKHPFAAANGSIGILPYIYEEARKYYAQIVEIDNATKYLLEEENKNTLVPKENPTIHIAPPIAQKPKRKRKFSFLEEEEKDAQ